ncbi:hypothetical protein [Actinomadura hibisca]|uniref:hypothetical protein n=1 Tax=Actinomadura hibisca TaxID=68565 RepID=UPI00082E2DBF|nr:hypothetical protein [Actinomadura hibisca]
MPEPSTAESAASSPQPTSPSRWIDIGAPIVRKYGTLCIDEAIHGLSWLPFSPTTSSRLGFFDKTAIKTLIVGFKLPQVTHLAARVTVPPLFSYQDEIAVFGVEARYANGTCRIYAADTGADVIVLGDRFTPNPEWNVPLTKESPMELSYLPELPAGWDWGDLGETLICPCDDAHEIELDGRCPVGHVSPLRAMGLV